MANFLLKVVLCVDDPSGPVMETFHHTSLHVGRMMGLKVEIPVHVGGLPVDRDFRPISFLLLSSVSRKGSAPSSSCLHSELEGRPDPIEIVKEFLS